MVVVSAGRRSSPQGVSALEIVCPAVFFCQGRRLSRCCRILVGSASRGAFDLTYWQEVFARAVVLSVAAGVWSEVHQGARSTSPSSSVSVTLLECALPIGILPMAPRRHDQQRLLSFDPAALCVLQLRCSLRCWREYPLTLAKTLTSDMPRSLPFPLPHRKSPHAC